MITVYHAIVEAIRFSCPVQDIAEQIEAMDLLISVIGKVLFSSNGEEAAMLVAEIHRMWGNLWRLFQDDFMKTPTMHATLGFFEFFLSHQPRAHKAMGLKLESLHQYWKHGQTSPKLILTSPSQSWCVSRTFSFACTRPHPGCVPR